MIWRLALGLAILAFLYIHSEVSMAHVAVGDSIAVCMINGGADGQEGRTARVGASPAYILAMISALGPWISNRDIILSSGVSNNPSQIFLVGRQIDELRRAGARNIVLLGVGMREDIRRANGVLETIARMRVVKFRGIEPTGPDQVHPANCRKTYEGAVA